MVQYRHIDSVRRLAVRALEHGADRPSLGLVVWDLAARCADPKSVEIVGRGDVAYRSNVNPGTLSVIMTGLPCRKCPHCLRIRGALWKERAMKEIAMADRTWFVTLTMKPSVQHATFMEEFARKSSRGWLDSDFVSRQEEFLLRCNGGLRLVTKFWKNVRKPQAGEEPVRLKYLVVAERHKTGLPHFHALVHERAGSVTYRRLADRWTRYGFFQGKLVESGPKAARYVAKYIAKDMLGLRIRASEGYGLPCSPSNVLAAMRDGGVFRKENPLQKSSQTIEEVSSSWPNILDINLRGRKGTLTK